MWSPMQFGVLVYESKLSLLENIKICACTGRIMHPQRTKSNIYGTLICFILVFFGLEFVLKQAICGPSFAKLVCLGAWFTIGLLTAKARKTSTTYKISISCMACIRLCEAIKQIIKRMLMIHKLDNTRFVETIKRDFGKNVKQLYSVCNPEYKLNPSYIQRLSTVFEIIDTILHNVPSSIAGFSLKNMLPSNLIHIIQDYSACYSRLNVGYNIRNQLLFCQTELAFCENSFYELIQKLE